MVLPIAPDKELESSGGKACEVEDARRAGDYQL